MQKNNSLGNSATSPAPMRAKSLTERLGNGTLNPMAGQEIDSKMAESVQSPAPTPKNNKPSISSLLKSKPIKTDDDRLLHGTGVTKKLAVAAEKQLEKTTKKSSDILGLIQAQKAHEVAIKVLEKEELKHVDAKVDIPVISVKPLIETSVDADWEWDKSQLTAIDGIMNDRYSCLIGAAGTGKTTVVKEIVKQIEDKVSTIDLRFAKINPDVPTEHNLAICFCSFTGRAVQQMKKPLPKKFHPMCNTVHATLGYTPEWYEKKQDDGSFRKTVRFVPTFGEWRKLPYEVYIIDETGTLAIYLWDQLLAAMPEGAKVLFVGDINQLPPVQGRSVLGFAMNRWPTYELTKIHRQAAESPIIANAHRILNGQFPEKVPGQFDLVRMPAGGIATCNNAVKAVKILHNKNEFDPLEDAFIVPQNKDICGQVNLNTILVSYFNPERKVSGAVVNKRTIIKTGIATVMYAVGDKVMLLANDRERELTNGMTGVVVHLAENGQYRKGDSLDAEFDAEDFLRELNAAESTVINDTVDDSEFESKAEKEKASQRQASHIMTVKFGENEVPFQTAGEFKLTAHAYAITCHKSQGGEYPNVIILCHSTNWRMLSREWLYTAVTRAQKRVILLYNDKGIAQALGTQRIKGNNLQQKIDSFNKLQDQKDVSIPQLPKPEKW